MWLRRAAAPPKPTLPSPPPDDELGSLGLSAVRPATAPRIEKPSTETPFKTASSPVTPRPTSTESTPSISTVSEARPVASQPDDAFIRPDSPLWPDNANAVRPLLRSLAVTLGGGVAVLRHDDDAYTIDALVGVPGVRSPRPLKADDHPLHRVPQDTVLSILGPESRQSLNYYAEPEAAVGQAVARALAEPPARRVLLVADVPPGEDELSDDALELVGHYGNLLAALTTLEDETATSPMEEAVPDEEATWTEDPSEDASESASSTEESHEEEVLPRAVVIQNHMDAATAADRPLAFALVTLAAADAVLRGDPERVAKAEADLRARLEGDLAQAIEPFGDLMLGVFLDATPDEALAWAGALADTEPPVLVGLVPSATDTPETVRASATEAIEEAYHQGGGLAVASA